MTSLWPKSHLLFLYLLMSVIAGHTPAETLDAPPEILSIASLRTWVGQHAKRVSVRGVVTRTGTDTYMQDATGGVLVHFKEPPRIKVGDELEVSGVPHALRYSSQLEDASARVLWATVPPPPMAITADQAARGDFDGLFVEIEARLDHVDAVPGGAVTLSLSNERQSFLATLPRTGDETAFSRWERHSMVRVRGICVMDAAHTQDGVPFVLLLRSGDDAEELAGPPWWSPQLLLRDGLILLCASLLVMLILARVRAARVRAVQQEREHIAREIHDTLAQSFAGVAFQLQAVRAGLPPTGDALAKNVDVAINMVRYSHQEARRSISALHRRSASEIVLEAELLSSLNRMVDQSSIQVCLETSGTPQALPLRVTNALLRIGQEAGANAISHADASAIRVRVGYSSTAVTLEIEDNGCGFEEPAAAGKGLGLLGMATRARKLQGTVDFVSTRGQGTLVRATIPLRKRSFWAEQRKR